MSHDSPTPQKPHNGDMSPAARQLLQHVVRTDETSSSTEKVYIPDTAESAYWAYEQLRNAVEYQEQHLLMRSSINRFLVRQFDNPQKKQFGTLGYEVIRELTKSRYLTNGTVAESTVRLLDERIAAYRQLYVAALPYFDKNPDHLSQLILGIASADIQKILLPNKVQDGVIDFTYHSFQAHLADGELQDQSDAIALYIAVHRALLRSDMPTINQYMFTNQFPQWHTSAAHIKQTAAQLCQFDNSITESARGKQAPAISRLVYRQIAPYVILLRALQDSPQPATVLRHPEKLSTLVAEAAERQYSKARRRLGGSVLRAITFIFITKMIVALLVELPYEYYILGHVHYLALAVNLLFPPLYMLFTAFTVRMPDHRNTDAILHQLRAVLYQKHALQYSLRGKEGKNLSLAFNVAYVICTLAVIGGISYGLNQLGFNLVSGAIFFIFLSTVSFFGYRITQSVRELVAVDRRNLFDMIWGVILLPFTRIGQWLSVRYSKFNIFIVMLDFVIEAPYKTVLRVYEQWMAFLREKQDDVLR